MIGIEEKTISDPTIKDPNKKELMSFASLYRELLRLNDIIIEIPSNEIESLKEGLKDIKYRTGQRSQKAGFDIDSRRLEIAVLETNPETDVSKIRITYKDKKGIRIMSIKSTVEEM